MRDAGVYSGPAFEFSECGSDDFYTSARFSSALDCEQRAGVYSIQGSYDVDVPSKYFFTVVACDRNGNRTTKEFSLLVEAPQVEETSASEQDDSAPTYDYIVNVNTGKFHYPSCSDVKRMNESNKLYVNTTRDDLLSRGYQSCGHCHP